MSNVVDDARKRIEELSDLRKQISAEMKENYQIIKNNTPKDSMIITNPKIARTLIKKGHNIIDIKPNKKDKFHNKSVYVFKLDDTLEEDFNAIKQDRSNRRKQWQKQEQE